MSTHNSKTTDDKRRHHNVYNSLQNQLKGLEKKKQWENAIDMCDAILSLIQNNQMELNPEKWRKKKVDLIQELKQKNVNIKEKTIFPSKIEVEEKLEIHSEIDLEENLHKFDIGSQIKAETNLNDYLELIKKANLMESGNQTISRSYLLRCLEIIEDNEEEFLKIYPNRTWDRITLKARLEKMVD